MKVGRASADAAARLASRQLVVVTGKGGVGKSAVAAVLGRMLHRVGRRVLVLELDPRESLHQMLGVAPSGGEVLEVEPGLFLQNLQPRKVLDDYVREHLRVGPLARRVLASPVYRHFAAGAPGLKELAVLGHALSMVEAGWMKHRVRVDVVVLDAPATGHGASLLAAPGLAAEVIEHGPFGRLAAELSAFVSDPARCGIVVVTTAEEMPADEALDLAAMLEARLHRVPELLVVNGVYPPCPDGPVERDDQGPLALWRRRRAVNDRELGRLRAAWRGRLAELPLLPLERGPALVEALRARLAQTLTGAAVEGTP